VDDPDKRRPPDPEQSLEPKSNSGARISGNESSGDLGNSESNHSGSRTTDLETGLQAPPQTIPAAAPPPSPSLGKGGASFGL
jgi:hypothetical protein